MSEDIDVSTRFEDGVSDDELLVCLNGFAIGQSRELVLFEQSYVEAGLLLESQFIRTFCEPLWA